MSDDGERWDEHYRSGSYREHWDSLSPAPPLVALVGAGVVPAGATALDLGCGAGTNTVFLASQGLTAIGVDLSPTALEIAAARAREAGVSVDWRQGSVLDLPVDDDTIDFAHDRGCFHGIAAEDRPAYAAEAYRVLKPGARLLITGGRVAGEAALLPLDEEWVDRVFTADRFERGPVLPLRLPSDAAPSGLEANLVVLRRR